MNAHSHLRMYVLSALGFATWRCLWCFWPIYGALLPMARAAVSPAISIIYNYYLGENAMATLSDKPAGIYFLRFLVIGVVFCFSDPMMGILALVNLLVIMMLFPVALRAITDFREQLKRGADRPVLNIRDYQDLDLDPNQVMA